MAYGIWAGSPAHHDRTRTLPQANREGREAQADTTGPPSAQGQDRPARQDNPESHPRRSPGIPGKDRCARKAGVVLKDIDLGVQTDQKRRKLGEAMQVYSMEKDLWSD